ncbi:aquaporin Z [Arthrobacter cavernae]|uniref:Aquaporin Z n=1 Tax=Arthrobacter cavernae TaxID=2817681 RepID=A0A939HHP4_9MICC|nr:aquaporin Z [Arthrobacter cavernae]MBO1268162.1 aquaporin Z [Arthrobacter cavernae]
MATENPAAPKDDVADAPALFRRLGAEVFGTFLLVFAGMGTVLFAAKFPGADATNPLGVGFIGVSLALGLTVLAGAYAVGHISGAHFNPAVTVGVAIAGRLPWKDVPAYIGAQVVGAVLGSSLLAAIAAGGPAGFFESARAGGFASNGYGEHSPGGFGLVSALLVEFILTAVFVLVILLVTDKAAVAGFAPLVIGLTLTLIHLASIPVTNTSVNPARSFATALYDGGGWAFGQLWVFIVAPIAGAALGAIVYKTVLGSKKS